MLRRVARQAAAAVGFRTGYLSVAVVGVAAMRTLHRRYLNIDAPTDVLAFDLGCDSSRGWLEGEIVLCADVASRQAARRGGGLVVARAELALYLVHGILHLAGMEDRTQRGFRRMHTLEDELLSRLGLGPVYQLGQSERYWARPGRCSAGPRMT